MLKLAVYKGELPVTSSADLVDSVPMALPKALRGRRGDFAQGTQYVRHERFASGLITLHLDLSVKRGLARNRREQLEVRESERKRGHPCQPGMFVGDQFCGRASVAS